MMMMMMMIYACAQLTAFRITKSITVMNRNGLRIQPPPESEKTVSLFTRSSSPSTDF